jgi:hypothetical protein
MSAKPGVPAAMLRRSARSISAVVKTSIGHSLESQFKRRASPLARTSETKRRSPYNFDAAADFLPICEKLCSFGILTPHPEAVSERKAARAPPSAHYLNHLPISQASVFWRRLVRGLKLSIKSLTRLINQAC